MDAIREFQVVCNDEEQYSIWPADRQPPDGWHADGVTGDKQTCLRRVEEVWTDMRPASLRRALDRDAGTAADG